MKEKKNLHLNHSSRDLQGHIPPGEHILGVPCRHTGLSIAYRNLPVSLLQGSTSTPGELTLEASHRYTGLSIAYKRDPPGELGYLR